MNGQAPNNQYVDWSNSFYHAVEDLIYENDMEKYVRSEDLLKSVAFFVMVMSMIIVNIYACTKAEENIGDRARYLDNKDLSSKAREYIQNEIEVEKSTSLTVWCITLTFGILNIPSRYLKYICNKLVAWCKINQRNH